jgi:hypothetical protein
MSERDLGLSADTRATLAHLRHLGEILAAILEELRKIEKRIPNV